MTSVNDLQRKITELRDIHRRAMDLASLAMIEQRRGFIDRALVLFRDAFELEARAADLVANDYNDEPTRSVLHRSAATLALDCNDIRAAERLAARGLSGHPPEAIADELREVFDRTQFDRHLKLRGIELAPDEVQFTINGPSIAPGMAQMNVFLDRVRYVERLMLRTGQRLLNQPFQERLRSQFEIFISVPRSASFAVSLKVGRPEQLVLPGLEDTMLDQGIGIVNEFLTCVDMLNRGQDRELASRFEGTDATYYQNFLALGQKIAPDGELVSFVGFTSMRTEGEQRVPFTRPRQAISTIVVPSEVVPSGTGKQEVFYGRLRFADETGDNNKIRLIDDKNKRSRIISVPQGMMTDIVKPLWGEYVSVIGIRYGRNVTLQSIEPISPDEDEETSPNQPSDGQETLF